MSVRPLCLADLPGLQAVQRRTELTRFDLDRQHLQLVGMGRIDQRVGAAEHAAIAIAQPQLDKLAGFEGGERGLDHQGEQAVMPVDTADHPPL